MKSVIVRDVCIGEGMPKICVPIVGTTKGEILNAAIEITTVPCDLVEWRADWYEDVFEPQCVEDILLKLRKIFGEIPVLFTFRTKKEGGEKEISYERYGQMLKNVAATKNVDLIDVETFFDEQIDKLVAELKEMGVKVIGSNHDFGKTPEKEELIRKVCQMQSMGVDITKIAVMPQHKRDVLTLLTATEEITENYADRPLITMSMSGIGTLSRISGEIFGSAVTFGAVRKASAPGQIGVNELKNILETLHRAL